MYNTLANFTDVLDDEIGDSQPMSLSSLPSPTESNVETKNMDIFNTSTKIRPTRGTGKRGDLRSIQEIDPKYRDVFTYPYFNFVQSNVIDDALYSDKSIVVSAPTGSGKTVVFEMAIVQLLMELEDKHYTEDFKIIYMAPVKALCTERLTEWYPKFTKLGLMCIEATGDTDVDFTQLKPYNIIITTPEKWDMLTRRWRDHRSLVEVIKLFLIDEVHILNDEARGPVLEAVVSRMKTIESSAQSVHRIEVLQHQLHGSELTHKTAPSIRFVAVSATVSNPEDVANWLGTTKKPAVFHKFGDESRPVKIKRIVEGYPCSDTSNIFKFDIFLNYKLWPIIQKYHCGKPTLIFCNTRKSVLLTAQTLSRELTINFSKEQRAKLTALASSIKTKTLQQLVLCGVGCHHAGLLFEERHMIELAFRNRDLPILITTTTLAMGVNLPAHLVIIKNTQQYVNGAYQEYSISTVLQMVGRAGRPQFDTEATAVIMTRLADKARYQALVGGCEPLQSFLHKRLPENLNSEAALGTVGDVAQCVQWLRSTFLYVRAARDPKKYLNLPQNSPQHLISKKIEELCVRAMNSLASSGLITMDEASCIESTEAGRLMSIYYLDLETMKQLMKIEGTESLDRLLTLLCESHELSDMHLRVDERRCLNALNRNNAAATIRFPMKGKISTRQMKLNCIIQAVLGCLVIPDPSLNQEAMKIMRVVQRICKCLVAYVTRPDLISRQPEFYSAVLNSIILAKCIEARLWENSHFVSKQLKGIGPTFSTLLATAGKVNFMLLEESHPRDLERIMNKSAPAGNVIRKQVSLLPKYHMSMIPVDEKTVTLQLVLLNQSYLSENVEQLTAGSTHKSYIVVGDSVNHLLLLASFKDNDLISVFDGTISYEIRRKHNFEHKIFAHCISTTFVGIDVQSEYVFNNLNQFFSVPSMNSHLINEMPVKETAKKQTCTTYTPKVRKRKSTTVIDKTQSKEKKKRDYTIIESFKYLKKTFETASKNIKENINLSNKSPYCQENTLSEKPVANKDTMNKELTNVNNEIMIVEDIDSDDFIDNEKVDSILNEIENEMFTKKNISPNDNRSRIQDISGVRNAPSKYQIINESPIQLNTNRFKKRRPSTAKSNYSFIELLERNLDLSDDETATPEKKNGFTDTIKSQINKYLQKTETKAITPDTNVQLLVGNVDKVSLNTNTEPNVDSDMNRDTDELPPTQKLYPCYEIKEILDGTNLIAKDVHKVENQFENTNLRMTPDSIHENKYAISASLTDRCTISAGEDDSIILLDNEIKMHATNNQFQINNDQIKSIDLIENDCEQYNINKSFDVHKHYSDNSYVNDKNFKIDTNSSNNILENVGINMNGNNFNKSQAEQDVDNIIITENNQAAICNTIDNKHLSLVLFQNANTQNTSNQNNEETLMQCFSKSFDENENTLERNFNSFSNCDLLNNKNRNSTMDASLLPQNTNHINTNNITYVNKSNEGQNYYKDNFIKPNLAHCSKNMFEKFNPTARYAENYFYSASKIDVTSKQTAEYCVQVIKQVKVDLNITKIISSNKPQSRDMPQNDSKSKVDNICKIVFEEPSQPNFNNLQEFCHDKKDFVPIIYQKQNTNSNLQKETTENKNTCQLLTGNSNINDNELNINKKIETEERCDNVDANTKVHNILQKYSKILGKDKTKTQTPACSTTNRNIPSNKSITTKSKKPFKISDIQKFQTTLSNTIVGNNHPVERNAPLTNIEDNMLTVKEHVQSNSILYRKPYCNDKSADKDDTYTYINEIDLEPINLSTDVDFEAVTEVDQSMFDPKTLLQSTLDVDSEEIIPPPSQFCDYPITQYSDYNYDNNIDGYNTVGDYSRCEASQSSCSSDMVYNNTNIFEDRCITHLTPSREIETWTLDKEDCCMSPNTSQSFTIIRRNKPNFCDIPETSIKTLPMSRQTKLGRFKFNHKTKLRKLK